MESFTGRLRSHVSDLYPSRTASEPAILRRRDPVVYEDPATGAPGDGPLTPAQIAEYEQDGFLLLPGFLSEAEVRACHSELYRLRRSSDVKERPESIIEPESFELRSLFAVHNPEISRFFSQIAADPRIVSMVQQILGGDVYVHQSRVNLKPGFVGKEFYWHSDFETWHVEDGMPRMRAVSCSILLTENNQFNGPLMLVPGSQRSFVTCLGDTPDDHYKFSLRRQEVGVPDNQSLATLIDQGGLRSAIGPAGTMLLFDCNTMHGSGSNISPYPRSNLFFVYNSVENQLVEPICGKHPRPEFVASREYCPTIRPHSRVASRWSAK